MGYTPKRTVYVLEFDKHPGLEVKAVSVSTSAFLTFAKMTQEARQSTDAMEKLFSEFADRALRSWNLEDEDGTPVPPTLDGLLSQEFDFVFEIIDAWTDTVAGVSDPLEQPSPGGSPSLVASLPMEVPSQSQAS